jgi:hypothetical protein
LSTTSNRETKDFVVEQAQRMAPDVPEKSGVWYRLNRPGESQGKAQIRHWWFGRVGDRGRGCFAFRPAKAFAGAPPLRQPLSAALPVRSRQGRLPASGSRKLFRLRSARYG